MANIRYTRNLFLRGMSVVYLFAFTSLYLQIPGLYGTNGILPARTQLEAKSKTVSDQINAKPTLLWFAPYLGLDTEYMMDILALTGIFLSFLGFVSQRFCSSSLFFVIWILYQSLYQVGQTFLWFQWDILLLEAGFLTILVAPVSYFKRQTSPRDPLVFWLVKWLLFRLMFASGVVKLTSRCPTWWGLTALNVHFESQCIPTPLAWYIHHLPSWMLRLGVVGTYVIEIAVPFLFFFPNRRVRIISFYLQVLLQLTIILTGNYNFFNLLTIVLCISLLDDDFFYRKKKKDNSGVVGWLVAICNLLVPIAVYGAVLYFTKEYFSVRINAAGAVDADIGFTQYQYEDVLGKVLPKIMLLGVISLSLVVAQALTSSLIDVQGIFIKIFTLFVTLCYSAITFVMFGISLVPLSTLHSTGNYTLKAYPQFTKMYMAVDHLQITNSYGLFRHMTGIGGRPEIIIEGSNSEEGPWKEYEFLYKPGNVNSTMPFVAPHQPRLDWQMWFAALGRYQDNPWFVSFVYRLLDGQQEVLQLLDQKKNPFPTKPPKFIKASLYHYHYSKWNQRSSPTWWTRERIGDYLPIVSRDYTPIVNFLKKVKILGKKDIPVTNQWLKTGLDHIRYWAAQVESSILMLSMFSAGCAIIATKRK